MPPPILITGAAGFIGSHLADHLLAAGARVVGFDNFCDFYPRALKESNLAAARANPRFTLIEADIRDRDAVMRAFAEHQPAVIIHLAAMAGVRPSIDQPAYYSAVNLDGTVNLLDAAIAPSSRAVAPGSPPPRFIFASSSSVYGNNAKVPFAEDDRVDHPISPYAATKKAGELLCHTYHHVHQLPVACLRFFTVFGPRQRPDLAISKFLHLIAAGKPVPIFGDGSTSRDYTYINDIIAGIQAVISSGGDASGGGGTGVPPVTYRIYNLGGSSPVSLRDMIATIERVTGRKAVLDHQPMQVGDVERTWADLTRSQTELGYHPTTSLEAGIAQQWAWMQQRNSL